MELISGRDAVLTDCNDEGIGIPYILGASNIESITYTNEKSQVVSNKGDILLSIKGMVGKLYFQQEVINISRRIMAVYSANVRECSIDDFDWVSLNEKVMLDNKRSIVHTVMF